MSLGRDDRWLNSIRNPKSKTVLIFFFFFLFFFFLLTKDNKHISKISIYFDTSRILFKSEMTMNYKYSITSKYNYLRKHIKFQYMLITCSVHVDTRWVQTRSVHVVIILKNIKYKGLPSVIFGRKVRESFRKLYGIDIKVIYTSFKVKNYFSLKCHTPLPLLAKVVYKFQCLHDVDKVYIGKTRRHLATRVKEHGHSTSSSAIRDHLSSLSNLSVRILIQLF